MAPPTIRICVQNGFYTQPKLHGVAANCISISGTWVQADRNATLAEVLAYNQADVEARFTAFLNGHPEVVGTTGLVCVDIEEPIHPADWWNHTLADQDTIIQAWKMRMGVVRAALPSAELGAYGTLVPDERGDATDATYQSRLATMQRAHTDWSAYTGLDVWLPIAYPRFGPLDGNSWKTYYAYGSLGVDGARAIGPNLPVKPFIYHTVSNGASANNGMELLDTHVPNPLKRSWDQLLAAFEAKSVSQALFWIGGTDTDTIAGSGRSIYQYVSPARPVAYYF